MCRFFSETDFLFMRMHIYDIILNHTSHEKSDVFCVRDAVSCVSIHHVLQRKMPSSAFQKITFQHLYNQFLLHIIIPLMLNFLITCGLSLHVFILKIRAIPMSFSKYFITEG